MAPTAVDARLESLKSNLVAVVATDGLDPFLIPPTTLTFDLVVELVTAKLLVSSRLILINSEAVDMLKNSKRARGNSDAKKVFK